MSIPISTKRPSISHPDQGDEGFLRLVFRPEERRRVERLIETLRRACPGEESAVRVNLQLEVQRESNLALPPRSLPFRIGDRRPFPCLGDWMHFLSLKSNPRRTTLTDRNGRAYWRYCWRTGTHFSRPSTTRRSARTWCDGSSSGHGIVCPDPAQIHVNRQSPSSFGYLAFFTAAMPWRPWTSWVLTWAGISRNGLSGWHGC